MSGPKGVELENINRKVDDCCHEINFIMKRMNLFRHEIEAKNLKSNDFTSDLLKNVDSFFEQAENIFNLSLKINKIDVRKRKHEAELHLSEMKKLDSEILQVKRNINQKMIELRDSIVRKVKTLENAKKEIVSSYSSCNFQVSSGKLETVRKLLKELSDVVIPSCPEFDFVNFNHESIIKYQDELDLIEDELKKAGEKAREYIQTINLESANAALSKTGVAKFKTIEDLIAEKKAKMNPGAKEADILEKANVLLSKVTATEDKEKFRILMEKYDDIKSEEYS
ncbi:MAG TPA: hypothetical protein PKK26_13775, partial [Candidatus Wallbacteria bacterium]|nr:hypothetical protein [Candidatus Wallbacteria bacterium]